MLKWRHFHRESGQKDHAYGILEKGRCPRQSSTPQWVMFSWKLSQRPTLEKATSHFLLRTNFTKRKGPLFRSQCTGPGEPPRIPGFLWTVLLRGGVEAALQQDLSPADMSRHCSPQAWTPHPLTAYPLPFLSGRRLCLKQFESFDSLVPGRRLNVKRNSSACLRFSQEAVTKWEVYPSTHLFFCRGVLRQLQTLNSLLLSSVHESTLPRCTNRNKQKWSNNSLETAGFPALLGFLAPQWALVIEMGLLTLHRELNKRVAYFVFP